MQIYTSLNSVPLALCMFAIVLSLVCPSQSRVVQSRHQLSEEAERQPHIITKRNAWWSKKSTDDSRIPEDAASLDLAESMGGSPVKQGIWRKSVLCYMEYCMGRLAECRAKGQMEPCQLMQHRCAKQCLSAASASDSIL